MKALTFFIALFFSPFLFAQNLNGVWTGTLGMGGGCFSQNNMELQLHFVGDSVYGDCYQYENIDYYVKKKIYGTYDHVQKQLTLHETVVTTFRIHPACVICIKNFYLTYEKIDKVEKLAGTWDGVVLNTGDRCSTGPIVLSRIKESAFKEVPEIPVDTGTIRLDFYDNAEVDGDSITVLVDKNVVATHQRLTTKPITTYITIDLHNKFHEVEMVAENLGSIPPNTAMLIITAGDKKYQLFLSSTEEKSARVRFLYDPR